MISEKIINEEKTYSVRITWSDENNGDLENSCTIKAKTLDEAFNNFFLGYFMEPKKMEKEGQFLDENNFTYDVIMDEDTLELVLFSELEEEKFKYNEDGEIENYIRTYNISIYEDDEE
jgi:hypothetical protein